MPIKNKILINIYGEIGVYWPLEECYLGYLGYKIKFIDKIFVDKIFAYNIMPKDSRVVRYHLGLMGIGRYCYREDFFRLHDAYKK
jgi:hypothetical protein